MPRIFTGFILAGLLTIGFLGCSSTEKITEEAEEGGFYPAWYESAEFSEDSVSFNGYAMAVSSDSVIAMANAELQARVNLESHIAAKLESVREELDDNGSSIATNTDFIITLRNAHNSVQEAADAGNRSAQREGSYFRGFVQVSISKSELLDLLELGFSGKESYWQELRSTELFQEVVQ